MRSINDIWETYRSSWSNNDSENRETNLREVVTDDFEYRDPNVELKGYEQLSEYMGQFQNEFKLASFTITDFNIHHDRVMANWDMLNEQKDVVGNGVDFAQFENGKLKHITGFFKEN